MKIKSLPIGQVKAGPEDGLAEGEFVVYPSTFTREPDSYGDVVAKGAFLEGIKEWQESGDVMPGMYLHDPNQIVAGAIETGEDDHGWWVKGAFDEEPHAQKIYKWLKGRRLSALSFAYDTREEGEVELEDGRKVNELRKLMPLEFSFLPKGFAANSDTSVVAVKALMDDLVLPSKSADALREARDAIDSVLSSLEDEDGKSTPSGGNDQEKASGDPEAKSDASDEEPEGAKSSVSDEEPKASPSVDVWATHLSLLALGSPSEEGVLS